MRFVIDLDQCEDMGQCAFAAPDVFSIDDSGQQSLKLSEHGEFTSAQLTDDEAESAQRAADVCPMQAIRMRG